MTYERRAFIECGCHAEALEVSRWDDESETYLSLWYLGCSGEALRWRDRVRLAWKVLRHGRGHPDDIILHDAGRRELMSALLTSGEQWGAFGSNWSTNDGSFVITDTERAS